MRARSSTERPNTPTVSSEGACVSTPARGMSAEGRLEAVDAAEGAPGRMTEPTVCVPSATGTMPAATAAAEPEEEPPGVCSGLRGLRVVRGCEGGKLGRHRLAQDDGAGAAQRRDAGGIRVGWRPLRARQPFSVGMSAVSMMSLMPTGTPCSGPTPLPSGVGRRRPWPAPARARGRGRPRPGPAARARRCARGRRRPAPPR